MADLSKAETVASSSGKVLPERTKGARFDPIAVPEMVHAVPTSPDLTMVVEVGFDIGFIRPSAIIVDSAQLDIVVPTDVNKPGLSALTVYEILHLSNVPGPDSGHFSWIANRLLEYMRNRAECSVAGESTTRTVSAVLEQWKQKSFYCAVLEAGDNVPACRRIVYVGWKNTLAYKL
jgi:hypothetical protein